MERADEKCGPGEELVGWQRHERKILFLVVEALVGVFDWVAKHDGKRRKVQLIV